MRMVACAVLALILMVLPAQAQRLVPQVAEGYEICVDTYGHLAGAATPIHVLIAVGPRSSGTDEAACIWGGGQSARQAHDNAHKECKALYQYCLNFADSAGPYPAIRQINAAGGTLTPELYQQVRTALLRENRNSAGGKLSGQRTADAPPGGTAPPPASGGGNNGGGGLANPGMATAANGAGNLNHCLRGMYDRAVDRGQRNVIAPWPGFEVDHDLYFKNGCGEAITAYICYVRESESYECIQSPDIAPGGISYTFASIIGDRFFYFVCPAAAKKCNDLGLQWYNNGYSRPRGSDLRRGP